MSNIMRSLSFDIGSPVELHGVSKKSKNIALTNDQTGTVSIDANLWLPLCAEHYNISNKLSDYIMIPVPTVISEIPNTNGDSVSKQEFLRFHPEYGQPAYKTFKGKPCYTEHDNKDYTKAKGVILDVYARPLRGFKGNHIKIVKLLGFDRTKDPALCNQILERKINTYSMGIYYKMFKCSICGNLVGQNFGRACEHTALKRPTYMYPDGRLVYRQCISVTGFETSAVVDPAYVSAVSNKIMVPGV